jgi:hypothetical protein
MTTRTVVPTFAVPAMENQRSGGVRPSSCESRARKTDFVLLLPERKERGVTEPMSLACRSFQLADARPTITLHCPMTSNRLAVR